jgi:hypothetical protein
MTSRVEALARERNAPAVKFMEFIKLRAREPDAVICFFEGEDQKYFGVRLDMAHPPIKWQPIDCGGKSIVLKLFTLVRDHAEYSKTPAAYFVDQDFDGGLEAHYRGAVYQTPCYSIENCYATETCFLRVASAELKVSPDGEEAAIHAELLSRFRERQSEFDAAIRPVNAWIKAHRKLEQEERTSKRLNLSQFTVDNFVVIAWDGVTRVPDELSRIFKDGEALSAEQLKEADDSFGDEGFTSKFRGKFECDFLRTFLVCLKDVRVPPLAQIGPRLRLQLSRRNFISELSQYADTPPCLRQFIANLAALYGVP